MKCSRNQNHINPGNQELVHECAKTAERGHQSEARNPTRCTVRSYQIMVLNCSQLYIFRRHFVTKYSLWILIRVFVKVSSEFQLVSIYLIRFQQSVLALFLIFLYSCYIVLCFKIVILNSVLSFPLLSYIKPIFSNVLICSVLGQVTCISKLKLF